MEPLLESLFDPFMGSGSAMELIASGKLDLPASLWESSALDFSESCVAFLPESVFVTSSARVSIDSPDDESTVAPFVKAVSSDAPSSEVFVDLSPRRA